MHTIKISKNLFCGLGLVALVGTPAINPRIALAAGDSATKYNLFVPANALSSRPSYLVVTNVSAAAAHVDVEDDAADGDSDDSALGLSLAPGESYVVRIRDGAVNDDAGGKSDGDFFKIRADHSVTVFMGSASSWEHDWVPSVGKSNLGTSFFLFSLPTSGSNADVNVFAYEDNTTVTLTDLTTTAVTATGRAAVNLASSQLVLRSALNQGEDLNSRRVGLGLDVLLAGHSYWLRATRPITVMTGHLGALNSGTQARDGGGFVPSANGSSMGSLFFFGIPHDAGLAREKELRVVCPSAATVALYGANPATTGWSLIGSSAVAARGHLDFVGAGNSAFLGHELYKLTVAPSHLGCNVFEANWLETGSFGTSDTASVVSSDEGRGLGYRFTAYMGPPGLYATSRASSVLTNNAAPPENYAAHLWIYPTADATSVTISDLDAKGSIVSSSLLLNANQYFDFVVDKPTYQQLTQPGLRPYLRVEASKPITVIGGNVNDNWLTYLQSVIAPTPVARVTSSIETLSCGETTRITLSCDNPGDSELSNLSARLTLPTGMQPVPGSYSSTPSSSSTREVLFHADTLAGGAQVTFSADVQFSCAALGCMPPELSSIQVECTGTSAGDIYAGSAATNLTLLDPSKLSVSSFIATDVPDYAAASASPHVHVSYEVTGSGSGTVSLERAINSSVPSATQTVLHSQSGAQSLAFDDPYTLHYEETRFYRLKLTEGSCVRTFGPLALPTSSGQSGGFAGGLESNGRLASKLARRSISRSSWASVHTQEAADSRTQSLDNPPPSPWLSSLLPGLGPDGARRVEATPGDLPALTNAAAVASADYLDGKGTRIGTALIVETHGELYEHSKILCDRASGAALDLVDSQAVAPDGAFVRTELTSLRQHSGESAVEFKLFEQADGSFVAQAAWLQEDYLRAKAGQRVLNVQAWSLHPGYELALALDILQAVQARPPRSAVPPASYFLSARTLGGRVEGAVHVSPEVLDGLSLRTIRLLENGAELAELEPLLMSTINKSYEPFLDVTLELVDADLQVLDRVWMSDGAWAPLDDAMWGGKTQINSVSTTDCGLLAERPAANGLALSGCAHLRAEVSEFAGAARHLGGGFAPLDVTQYAGLGFAMRSTKSVRICLESAGNSADQQPCVDLAPMPATTQVQLPLRSFLRTDTCEPAAIGSLETVSFVTREPGPFELSVGALTFTDDATSATMVAPCVPKSAQAAGGCSQSRSRPGAVHLGWLGALALLLRLIRLLRMLRMPRAD